MQNATYPLIYPTFQFVQNIARSSIPPETSPVLLLIHPCHPKCHPPNQPDHSPIYSPRHAMHLPIHTSKTLTIFTYPVSSSPVLSNFCLLTYYTHATDSPNLTTHPYLFFNLSVPTTQNTHRPIHPLIHTTALSNHPTNLIKPSNHPFLFPKTPTTPLVHPPVLHKTHPLNPSTMSVHTYKHSMHPPTHPQSMYPSVLPVFYQPHLSTTINVPQPPQLMPILLTPTSNYH